MDVVFFSNGNTGVSKNDKQVPELQEPWFKLYVEFLKSKGIEPEKCKFVFPSGKAAKVFKTSDGGYNWEFIYGR